MEISEFIGYDKGLKLEYPSIWDGDISGITTISVPKNKHVFFLMEYKFYKYWLESVGSSENDAWKETGAIVSKGLWETEDIKKNIIKNVGFVFVSENADLSICLLSKPFYMEKFGNKNDIEDGRDTGTAIIHKSASIATNVFIGENVRVEENVKIHSGSVIMSEATLKKGTVLYPNVTIYYGVEIGKNCRLHSGVVIGADGFGYKNVDGVHEKIWHTGSVIIGDNVEIGSLSSVDGGTFIPTRVGEGTIIDNQVQIGHNSQLGKRVIFCGHSGTAGSATVGDNTVVGGKAGIGNDVKVGKNCQIAGNAMVNTSWPENSVIAGHPARPIREWLRGLAYVRKQVSAKK